MRKNQPITGFPFSLVNRNSGLDINSGSVVGHILLDGVSSGTISDSPVAKGNGQWTVDITAAETDANWIGWKFVHADGSAGFTIPTGDNWSVFLPGPYTTGMAGSLLGVTVPALLTALSQATISVSSGVLTANIQLVRGDAYDGVGNPKRFVDVTHASDLANDGTTSELTIVERDTRKLILMSPGVITALGGSEYRAEFVLTNTQTKLLPAVTPVDYDVQLKVGGTSRWTPVVGSVAVFEDSTLT